MTATTPTRSATPRPSRLGPIAAGLVGAAGAGVLARHDPLTTSWYPQCPLHAATGVWCPGCGASRGLRLLVQGDLAGAVATNALLPIGIAALAIGWTAWWRAARGRPAPSVIRQWRPAWTIALAVVVAAFTVLRNLAPFGALAP